MFDTVVFMPPGDGLVSGTKLGGKSLVTLSR